MKLNQYMLESSGTLIDAAQIISSNKSRCVIITNNSKVVGVISEGDLLRALLGGADIKSPIIQYIHHGFIFLKERDLKKAYKIFREYGISLLPILDNNLMLTDVITFQQIMSLLELNNSE